MTEEADLFPERRQAWMTHKARLKARQDADLERQGSPPFVFTRDRIAAAVPAGSEHAKVPSSSPDKEPDIEPSPHPLFVYEPGDLNDFSVEDVRQVWERRRELCGTVEAAAEAFAILRVAAGADDNCRGCQAYMQHANVVGLADRQGAFAASPHSGHRGHRAGRLNRGPIGSTPQMIAVMTPRTRVTSM